jgi:hypothetical protein
MKRLYPFSRAWFALALLCGAASPGWATTRTVNNLADDGRLGTLRNAILAAVAGDTVVFSNGLAGTIILTQGELLIGQNITISNGIMATIAVSGNNSNRVFNILSDTTVTISGLTITNGFNVGTNVYCYGPGGIGQGGGILNNGTLTLLYCRVSGNTAQGGPLEDICTGRDAFGGEIGRAHV